MILSSYDYIKHNNKKGKNSNIVTITNKGPTNDGDINLQNGNDSPTIEPGNPGNPGNRSGKYSVRVSVIEPLLTNECPKYETGSKYGNADHIQYCNNMNEMPCASSSCCLLLIDDENPSKCVAGNSSGPVNSNNNHTHYKNKNLCYSNNNPQNLECPDLPIFKII
tara:strand:+ start:1312 stop:1806 length:495 start_codon:yes stop_codon:yes gene_type:complete